MHHDMIDRIITLYQDNPSALIQILLDIQRENHWISKEIIEEVSRRLDYSDSPNIPCPDLL